MISCKRTTRSNSELRPLNVVYNIFPYSAGSVCFEIGNTKILCAVSYQQGVPSFLKGKKTGWLSAEYSLLPASTHIRSTRESNIIQRHGRSVEISRLIGRVLRSVINSDILGENTLLVDCDVLQADGGTRTASICGAFMALQMAQKNLIASKVIDAPFLKDELAAISVGLCDDNLLLDLDFKEDSTAQADFNFVLTRSGKIVEVQGCAEAAPIDLKLYNEIQSLAYKGICDIFAFFDRT